MKSCRSPNRALKLTLFALLERYSTFDRLDLDEMNSKGPTPSGADDEIMDAISRVRIDGKAVARTERTIDKGSRSTSCTTRSRRPTSPAGRGPSAWR